MRHAILHLVAGGLALTTCSGLADADDAAALRKALLFHAAFDSSVDASVSGGDGKLYTAETLKRERVKAGLHSDAVRLEKAGGRHGGYLQFQRKTPKIVFFKGDKNLPYAATGFEGTVSLWMQLTPDRDLPPGYVDPLQITDKKWNDASFFLDFTKDSPRQFRLGAFSNYALWNPRDRKWDKIPDDERPLIAVTKPPFERSQWTHVAYTYRGYNTSSLAETVLYLNGKKQGVLRRKQQYQWKTAQVAVMLGIYYVGGIDDFSVFKRALTANEIRQLHELPKGVAGLR